MPHTPHSATPGTPAGLEALEPRVLMSADAVTSFAGDYNNSGQVEQGDLDLVLQHWGRDTAASGAPDGWTGDLPTGVIDQTELDRVLSNWGASFAPSQVPGDFDNSGQVDQRDLDLVLQNWGRDIARAGVPDGWVQNAPRGAVDQGELDLLLNNWGNRAVQSADRVVSWFTIGWSGIDPDLRYIGRNLDYLGWSGFVKRDVLPQIAGGVKRIMLHNPWGAKDNEPMQLDQLLHAQDEGLTFATEGFVEAWKPITDMGIEVIAYIGSGRDDPDFNPNDRRQWMDRAFRSVQPLLDAGMSIALDAAAPVADTSATYAFAQKLKARGVTVYVEAKPTRFTPHWFDYGVVSLDQTFLNDDIETGHIKAKEYGVPDSVFADDILRITKPRDGETYAVTAGTKHQARVLEIVQDGHVAVTDLNYWFDGGRTLDAFITPTVVVG